MSDNPTTRERWVAGMLWDSETDEEGLTFRLLGRREEVKYSITWPSKGSREQIAAALRALAYRLENHHEQS